jgi:multimeric flavodoxin WrbA
MNVISIFGGPRKKGNTATILGWVEEELKTLGHQIERINLSSKKVNGCLGCQKCKDNLKEPGCVQKDDGTLIINRMLASDVVIYASPLYYWGFSAQMKAFIDRCHCLFRGVCGSPEHTSFVEGQHHALIITAADPFENNAEQLLTSFQRMLVYNKAKCSGELLVHNCTTPDTLDKEIKENAIKFANQIFEETRAPYSIVIPGGAPNWVPKVE